MRIGIFGGSFDPIHKGHLALAKSSIKEIKLDKLFFVPAKISPFKKNKSISSPLNRLKMAHLAVKKIPKCKVSSFELKTPGLSYTFLTLKVFKKIFPKEDLFFLMGSDALAGFKKWHKWRDILKICSLVVGQRSGEKTVIELPIGFEGRVLYLKAKMPKISSTEIRSAFKERQNLFEVCPKEVAQYICKHHLYG